MKKFVLFLVKLTLVLAAAYGGYFLLFWVLWESDIGPDAYDTAYQHALLLQYQALAKEDRGAEFIVFGSSYVPFSIEKDTLEPLVGMPVQTLGVEASVGIPFLVDVLYDTAKPGDTVCYMMGTTNWYDEDFVVISAALESDKEKLQKYWGSRNRSKLRSHRTKLVWRKLYALVAGGAVQKLQETLTRKKQVYDLSSFDENGNMTVLREGTTISLEVEADDTLVFEDMEFKTLDMLNEFSAWCGENDIAFVITYAPTIDGSLAETEESLNKYHAQMENYMDADFLLKPQECFLPVTEMYNHIAHPNTEGAIHYSEALGSAYRDYLAGEEGSLRH